MFQHPNRKILTAIQELGKFYFWWHPNNRTFKCFIFHQFLPSAVSRNMKCNAQWKESQHYLHCLKIWNSFLRNLPSAVSRNMECMSDAQWKESDHCFIQNSEHYLHCLKIRIHLWEIETPRHQNSHQGRFMDDLWLINQKPVFKKNFRKDQRWYTSLPHRLPTSIQNTSGNWCLK